MLTSRPQQVTRCPFHIGQDVVLPDGRVRQVTGLYAAVTEANPRATWRVKVKGVPELFPYRDVRKMPRGRTP